MSYPAVAIANAFLRLAQEFGQSLSPMKLQKLVYFAHGWCLALTGEPLVNEPIEAWQFGPVIPSLYHALKHYRDSSVNSPITDGWEWGSLCVSNQAYSIDQGSDAEENDFALKLVKRVWDLYGGFSPIQLSNLTHEKNSPWDVTDKGNRHAIIDQQVIANYFRAMASPQRTVAG